WQLEPLVLRELDDQVGRVVAVEAAAVLRLRRAQPHPALGAAEVLGEGRQRSRVVPRRELQRGADLDAVDEPGLDAGLDQEDEAAGAALAQEGDGAGARRLEHRLEPGADLAVLGRDRDADDAEEAAVRAPDRLAVGDPAVELAEPDPARVE